MVAVADIVQGEGVEYLQTRFATLDQRKAICDIVGCRTEAMGTVAIRCDWCQAEYCLFRSCRNRSCPRCQGEARAKWLDARQQEILPVPYLHVVFAAPRELNVLARYCRRELYAAVIRASGQAVIDVGWSELQAQLGCQVHLQTWSQSMSFHLHAHCVVPCGGFSEDGSRWVSFEPDALPVEALSRRFRELLCKSILTAVRQGTLDHLPETVSIEKLLARVMTRPTRVYAKPPFGSAATLFGYLARYTYRVAITNDRITSYENHRVVFRWRDYRNGNEEKPCTLKGQEFVRRFLMHVPPRAFVSIRSYGFLGNRNRKRNLERARGLIGKEVAPEPRVSFVALRLCPACAGRGPRNLHMAPDPHVTPQISLSLRPPPEPAAA